jgi:hypothetical protein
MMWWMIWLPLAAASMFLLIALVGLRSKSAKLNRQLARTERYRKAFEAAPRSVALKDSPNRLPQLKTAVAERKALLKARLKKQEDKQRRLLSRLKNHS